MFISCLSHVFSFCVCSMFGHVLLLFLHTCFIFGVFFLNMPQMSHVVVHVLCIAVSACFEFSCIYGL